MLLYLYIDNLNIMYNDIWQSIDVGISWTLITTAAPFSPRYGHRAIVSSNGLMVTLLGGYDNTYLNDVWNSYFIPCTGTGYTLSSNTCVCTAGFYGSPLNNNGILSGCIACPGIYI